MALLTAGLYYTRGYRAVNFVSSQVISGVTVWTVQPITKDGTGTVENTVYYQETGVSPPNGGDPLVAPLATRYFANSGLSVVFPVSPLNSDVMQAIGTVPASQGLR